MKKHTHTTVEGSQRGQGVGFPGPHCTHGANRYCTTTGAHITVGCRCGAIGVICPQRTRTTWWPAADRQLRSA